MNCQGILITEPLRKGLRKKALRKWQLQGVKKKNRVSDDFLTGAKDIQVLVLWLYIPQSLFFFSLQLPIFSLCSAALIFWPTFSIKEKGGKKTRKKKCSL